MDLRSHLVAVEDFNTQAPLAWEVPAVGSGSRTWRDDFPAAWEAVDSVKRARPSASDFEVMDLIVSDGSFGALARSHLRHLLVRAFSYYQSIVDASDLSDWPWSRLAQRLGPRLLSLVSFNYDTTMEQAFKRSGHRWPVFVGPVTLQVGDLPVWKIHGSINFDADSWVIGGVPDYPSTVSFSGSDLPLRLVTSDELLEPRRAAEIVLPAEANGFTGTQWHSPGERAIAHGVAEAAVCILAGISYWPVDRAEVRRLVGALPAACRVVVINPAPSPILRKALKRTGRRVTYVDDAEEALAYF